MGPVITFYEDTLGLSRNLNVKQPKDIHGSLSRKRIPVHTSNTHTVNAN